MLPEPRKWFFALISTEFSSGMRDWVESFAAPQEAGCVATWMAFHDLSLPGFCLTASDESDSYCLLLRLIEMVANITAERDLSWRVVLSSLINQLGFRASPVTVFGYSALAFIYRSLFVFA